MEAKKHTQEDAARYGAKGNALLCAGQLAYGLFSGNFGFITESGHQGADAASLQAKANAMKENCPTARARRLRVLAASVLLLGGAFGIGGGLKHIQDGTREGNNWAEISGAVLGAAVNTAIARKSHTAEHDHGSNEDNDHQNGAVIDTKLHIMTDMGTGWLYAGALALEHKIPGAANAALLVNGTIIGSVGCVTMYGIVKNDRPSSEAA